MSPQFFDEYLYYNHEATDLMKSQPDAKALLSGPPYYKGRQFLLPVASRQL